MIELCKYGLRYGCPGFAMVIPWPHLLLVSGLVLILISIFI